MKKFTIILASIVTFMLLVAIVIPIIFKDDIQKQVRTVLDENLDAQVYFDPSKFGLTLFKNFPNPTASIDDFGIIGKGKFKGDTLISVGSFNITIDLFSLFGDAYTVQSINLQKPKIYVLVQEDGSANYEIVRETESENDSPDVENSSDFNLSINRWNISNGRVSYIDKSMDVQLLFEGFNHSGSGDISSDIYDLKTLTNIEHALISFEGTNYLNGQKLFADVTMNINLLDFKFTFKENQLRVNDFPLSFNGYVAMPTDNIEMDLSFATNGNSIKNLYSLVPGTYTEDFEGVKAEGDMTFSGFVKGTYNAHTMPAYQVALKVSDGLIAYPELPTPITNINIDLFVDCEDGNYEHTLVEIKKMHMDLGNNPIDGSMLLRNLKDYNLKADINASLNLAELSSMFPIEGVDMKGSVFMNLKADGIYDSIQNTMPAIAANFRMENGYIKSSEFPKALENMSFQSAISCPSGKMEDVVVGVNNFNMAMEGEDLSGNLTLKNLVDYHWDLNLKGGLDLEVISEIYPTEDMKYSGHLSADIESMGKYSDLEAERYDKLPAKGLMELKDFVFVSADVPQGMKITNASVSMDPRQLNVDAFIGTIGRSDLKLSGSVSNYISYVFDENELLKGKMNLNSTLLDLNEWMSGEEVREESPTDTTKMEVIAIPKNIDFEFQSSIKNILYDNLTLENAEGLLTLRDGVLDISGLAFNLLGGSVVMNGKYDTRIPDKPAFVYDLNIKELSIPQVATNFTTVQAFAPMAKYMSGNFSTNFSISGLLNNDLSPVYESLNGKGLIQIAEAFMKESKLVSGVAGYLKQDAKSSQLSIKDVIMKTSLENGRAYVSPFDVSLAGQTATLSGSIGADGSLDYRVSTEIEAGVIGQRVNQLLAGLQGQSASGSGSKLKLNFNVGGTYDNPKINLTGATNTDGTTVSVKEKVATTAKQEVSQQTEKVKTEAKEQIVNETDELMKKSEEAIQPHLDSLKKKVTENIKGEAGEVLSEELDSTANELKNSLQNLFKKKKKN